MKTNHVHILLLSALAGLLFSCSTHSNIGITKRHYRSGYFVESYASNAVKKAKPFQQASDKITADNTNSAESAQLTDKQATALENNQNVTLSTSEVLAKNDVLAKNKVPISNPNLVEKSNKSSLFVKNTLAEIPFYRFASEKRKYTFLRTRTQDDPRFSLGGFLWFIIVLLLILFILNFLLSFNLGGLVYLILLIALILLLFRLIGML